jgi:hypothetical protein
MIGLVIYVIVGLLALVLMVESSSPTITGIAKFIILLYVLYGFYSLFSGRTYGRGKMTSAYYRRQRWLNRHRR